MAATIPKPRRGRRHPSSSATAEPRLRRVAIYTRRSTDDEHQPFSIDAQIASLRSYINSQPGWTLVLEFSDDASGATTDRPDLQRALRSAKAGQYDVLLVVRVDRFSRRLSDLLDLLHELDSAGVAFCSATEPFDTSTPIGRMLIQLLGVFAEFERETIIDRVINGMTTKAGKGKWPGGTRPYGYHVDRDSQKLVPHPEEAPILRDIFRLYTQQRLGTRAIATELNQRGIRNRTGKPWSGYTIARILDNPAYTGDIAYRDVYVTDAHEPLIDRDTFTAARDLATARADAHHQRAASPSEYHLTGLITCPDCGRKYIGTAVQGRNARYRYYTASPATATAPPAATESDSPPTPPTPPSSKPSTSSTPTPTPSWTKSSPKPANSSTTPTPTGTPNSTPSPPRSPTPKRPSSATTTRSRTAPWTTPLPDPASPNSGARSHNYRHTATTSPPASTTSQPHHRPAPSNDSAPTSTTSWPTAPPASANEPSKPSSPRSASTRKAK
ncbi:recombinase family protein [Micromonospora sp. MS34]|uniref:recombinase family protein n=1 Tax=Micromonospora sp. MS34 TaxID=3385971 RepID=UPI0039A0DAE3